MGKPSALTALVATQFPELTLSTGQTVRNETPDAVMVMGTLQDGGIFQIQIEGGKQNQTGLQIDITGTAGDLQVVNEKSFVTKHEDIIRGAQGGNGIWTELPTPDRFHLIPPSTLDVSVQDLAQLYASFARDGLEGTRTTRDFSDAVAMHRLIDDINQASATRQYVSVREHPRPGLFTPRKDDRSIQVSIDQGSDEQHPALAY